MTRINSLYGSQTSPVALWMQNSVISTRNLRLHVSQISSVVLCMQNNVISIRITSLYWSHSSFVTFVFKTATLGPELQVSMGPRPQLSFCACKTPWLAPKLLITTATLWRELIVYMGLRPHLSFYACKTTWLAPELLVSLDPCPHLWFLHSKQRLLDQNFKSLLVPDVSFHETQRDYDQNH